MRFGWPARLWEQGVEREVIDGLEAAADWLERAGAKRVPMEFLQGEYSVATYYLVATAEASSNLARFDGVRYGFRHPHSDDVLALYTKTRSAGFGAEVQRRILLGTHALSSGYYDAYYLKAMRARTRIRREYEDAFARCDVMMMPTTPTLPFPIGEKLADPLAMYLSDIFTLGANLAGIPALSVPVSPAPNGLPRSVQLLGAADAEPKLLRAARAIEVRGDLQRLGRAHETEATWPTKR